MIKHTLAIGDPAPAIQVTDVNGHKVNLRAQADSFNLLVFLRYAGCPWCNLAIHRLALEHDTLQKNNCQIIAFVQSTPENIKTNIYGRHAVKPQFPIVADQKMSYYGQYGVSTSVKALGRSITKIPYWVKAVRKHGFNQTQVDGDHFLVPAMFLIGPGDQKIVQADYGRSYYEHHTFTSIYEHLFFQHA